MVVQGGAKFRILCTSLKTVFLQAALGKYWSVLFQGTWHNQLEQEQHVIFLWGLQGRILNSGSYVGRIDSYWDMPWHVPSLVLKNVSFAINLKIEQNIINSSAKLRL